MNKYTEYPSLRAYDKLGVPYVLTSDEWYGPLWTGHCMMLSTHHHDDWGDVVFFHELAHWMLASEWQRRWPDLALDRVTNSRSDYTFTSSTTPHLYETETRPARGWGERCITPKAAQAQEDVAVLAMVMYPQLFERRSWNNVSHVPSAAYEFGADMCEASEAQLRQLVEIAQQLKPHVTEAQVHGLYEAFNESERAKGVFG